MAAKVYVVYKGSYEHDEGDPGYWVDVPVCAYLDGGMADEKARELNGSEPDSKEQFEYGVWVLDLEGA